MEQAGQITLFDEAARSQAATTVHHVKDIRDRAGAAREYGRRARDALIGRDRDDMRLATRGNFATIAE
jgi:hypothetical protein